MLEKILESYPKLNLRFHRQISLEFQSKTCLYGAMGIGKTDCMLHHFSKPQFSALNKLYINCNDTRLNPLKDLENLKQFLKEKNISILILDNHTPLIPLDFILPFLIVISSTPCENFHNIQMPPITFAEFLAMRKIQEEYALAQYLKFGNLFEQLNGQKKGEFLKLLASSPTDFWILRNLILNLGQKISLHQIYTKLKKEGKLSKDRFYAYAQTLEKSGILFWLEKFEHALAPKKLYFWDFTLKNAVSFERNFNLLFENMVFLELLYHFKLEFFYTDKLDFYIPSLSLGILCAPFTQTLETRLNKLGKEREFCDSLLILSLNECKQGEHLGMPYSIIPFVEFAQNCILDSNILD
ncbi:ATP-binding protein [Helicobacter sp.]|uniref:ATP-binding protein n=1 Tax=Helicobacter sp. TaxID=218 RepID=UPI0025BC5C40|nr:ATP-binding protein [Helicobacter sp.]MCI5968924.1 ATP-binding protein [Helicobacter sp.]